MKELCDFKEDIHKCSKCGLCQAACPIYKITGNDCTVSRGQFIMLQGLIKGDLKMTDKLNYYLNLCLQCGKCSDFCPSGIDVLNVIAAAKYEYYKKHLLEKLIAFIKKYFIFGLLPNLEKTFKPKYKSKTFEKKVIYFGGCAEKFIGSKSVINIFNSFDTEVVIPNFPCCGISLFAMGDLKGFKDSLNSYVKILKQYDIKEIVTTCASCERTLKNYINWCDDEDSKIFLSEIKIRNIFEYIRENNIKLKLKSPVKVTYHKPCHIHNFDDIKWILENTENLEYIESENFDKCCGVNGIGKLKELPVLINVFKDKRNSIIKSGANNVLTNCLGCHTALKLYSFGKYKVYDIIEFLNQNI